MRCTARRLANRPPGKRERVPAAENRRFRRRAARVIHSWSATSQRSGAAMSTTRFDHAYPGSVPRIQMVAVRRCLMTHVPSWRTS